MKLQELRKRITPLPWKVGAGNGMSVRQIQSASEPGFRTGNRRIADCHYSATLANCCKFDEACANAAYLHHAANVLPGLVDALTDFERLADMVQSHFDAPEDVEAIQKLRQALARAEEVKE